jgi:hypothetical protein
MDRYRTVLARYGDLCRVLTATPDSVTREWVNVATLASLGESVASDLRSPPPVSLVDQSVMTDIPPLTFWTSRHPSRTKLRPTAPTPTILPTFRELPDPAMLRAPMQPARIYSVDLKAKTAVVSFSSSPEKVTRSWHDLIVLNPELLATYLVQHAP